MEVGPGCLTVVVASDVDASTVDKLVATARAELSGHEGQLVLDLAGVTFLGSEGIGALLGLQNETKAFGHKMRLINTPEHVRRVLHLTGLLGVLDVEPGSP